LIVRGGCQQDLRDGSRPGPTVARVAPSPPALPSPIVPRPSADAMTSLNSFPLPSIVNKPVGGLANPIFSRLDNTLDSNIPFQSRFFLIFCRCPFFSRACFFPDSWCEKFPTAFFPLDQALLAAMGIFRRPLKRIFLSLFRDFPSFFFSLFVFSLFLLPESS